MKNGNVPFIKFWFRHFRVRLWSKCHSNERMASIMAAWHCIQKKPTVYKWDGEGMVGPQRGLAFYWCGVQK